MTLQEINILKQRTGWCDEIINFIGSMAEANIYIRAGLQARKIGGRWALCRTDINWAGKKSEIDRGQFDHEKTAYWKARFAAFTPQEKLQIYGL